MDYSQVKASIIRIAKQLSYERKGTEEYAWLFQAEANLIWEENQTARNAFLIRYFRRKRPNNP